LAWGIAVLVAAAGISIIMLRNRLRDRREILMRESFKMALLATLDERPKSGSGRGEYPPREEHHLAGSSVDHLAGIARNRAGERPGRVVVRGASEVWAGGRMAINGRLGIPRDPIAGMDGLSDCDPVPARTFEIGVTSPARPASHLELDLGEGVGESGDDLQGVVGVVDVQAQAEGESALIRAEYVASPPHPLPDEDVAPAAEDLPDVVKQSGLVPVPAGRPRLSVAIRSQPGMIGLTVHVAGASDDRDDRDGPPRGLVIHTAPEGISQSIPSPSPCCKKLAMPR
jgi:hypothetical protein